GEPDQRARLEAATRRVRTTEPLRVRPGWRALRDGLRGDRDCTGEGRDPDPGGHWLAVANSPRAVGGPGRPAAEVSRRPVLRDAVRRVGGDRGRGRDGHGPALETAASIAR